MKNFDYSKENIIKSLVNVGLTSGDTVFSHSNIGFFGRLDSAKDASSCYLIFKEAIFDVIGEKGTWVTPTFSYSFCWKKKFDINKTPGVCGLLSEMLRQDNQALRSADANFSIAALGAQAEYLTKNTPSHSFGSGSFWEKFLNLNGKICNFNFNSASTFIHYVEKTLKVPYRYDKEFHGETLINNKFVKQKFYHFVRDFSKPGHEPYFIEFDKRAKRLRIAIISKLGKGQIVLISTRDTFELIKEEIKKNPNFLIRGEVGK